MKKAILQYLLILLAFNGYVFINGYFFNFKLPMQQWLIFSVASLFAVIPWLINNLEKKPNFSTYIKKFVLSLVSIAIMLITIQASAFSTMIVPGSREHNYVMYKICWPAMEARYDSLRPENRPNYFEIHGECEENVWASRDPLYGFD
ncbi:MAG: hypothetical protein ABFQ62_00860 [Patescibacteria group bacterium]